MASAPPIRLLRETATIKDVVRALNNFYDEFLEQNIRLNLDHANQEDINDGELNKQNATRVRTLALWAHLRTIPPLTRNFHRLPYQVFLELHIQTIWRRRERCFNLWWRLW